jgi:hypothetical protein
MSIVHTKTERRFNPHLFLLQGAQYHLRLAKVKTDRCYYDWIRAILLAALSIEAIGNSYGEVLIPGWEDFESASPIAKLRLVATRCGIKPDFGKQPWQTARGLIICRNRIAHAKRKHLEDLKECSLNEDGPLFKVKLESDLEKMITEDFAGQSCAAVDQIIKDLNKTLKVSELRDLTCNGHEYYAHVSP